MGRNIQQRVRALVLSSGTAASLLVPMLGAVAAGVAVSHAGASAEVLADGTAFSVGEVEVVYAPGTSASLAAAELERVSVDLVRMADGLLVGPSAGDGTPVSISLADLSSSRVERFDSSGLRAVLEAIHSNFTSRTGGKAYVVPDASQVLLRGAGEDYRNGSNALRFVVYPSRGISVAPSSPASAASSPAAGAAVSGSEGRSGGGGASGSAAPAEVRVTRQPDAVTGGRMESDSDSEVAAAAPILETTDPDDVGREPAPRQDRSTTVRVAPGDETVYLPGDLPISDVELDEKMDGTTPFVMTGFEFAYPKPHPDLPSPESLGDVTVRLVRTASGFVARPGEGKLVRLGDLGKNGPDRLYFSAFDASLAAVLQSFRDDSIVGVLVTPDPDKGVGPDQIERYYDERSDYGVTTLPLLVYVPQVTKIKTIASGDRIPTEQRLNSPKHASIVRGSPLQPDDESGAPRKDLLRFEPLNTYAFFKSRHPGRRVDVAIADGSVPGEPSTQGDAEVQYLVQEIKPWTIYAQLSNTGTEQTDEWRQRVGFVHNQLFGFDDIISLDYITSNLRESHALLGSYDIPLSADGRLRANVNGEWTEYKASDVGVANEQFEGQTFGAGGELRYNFLQIDDFFVDVYGGAMYRDIEVENLGLVNGLGQADVIVADFGLRAERRRANYSFIGEIGYEFSLNDLTGTDAAELEQLGRLDPDESWTVLHWDFDFSFYLDGVGSWNAGNRQLVHELAARFSGQYAFNNRLIPNYQSVGGGLYTVRGYDESVVAGDTGVFGSLEYRFHLPQALPVDPNPPSFFGRPFRVATDAEGLPPEWDMIFKGFVDAGAVENSRALGFESSETLLSTGLGLEVQIGGNFSFRTDWGIVLDEIGSDTPTPTTVGTQRWHFVFTLLY